MPTPIDAILQALKPTEDRASATPSYALSDLDSLAIIALVARLEADFGITVFPEDLIPENFESVDTLRDMVRRNGGVVG